MLTKEKLMLTYLGKDQYFKDLLEKLTTDTDLEYNEKSTLLACAVLLIRHYKEDLRYTSYADLAYYIILKYSLKYNDYIPLYDFSLNFGFYPIAKAILENDVLDRVSISNCFDDVRLDFFKKNDYIETLEQHNASKSILSDESYESSYFAPTSFGKSFLIVDYIRELGNREVKIVIIVPTKSLLIQTYQMIRNERLQRKLIIHDEMYDGENSVIAIFTQERALRLLTKHDIFFDYLFIDEAHNLLKGDSRSVLLSRLLARNRSLNPNQKVVYLSPLVQYAKNLRITHEQSISSHVVAFNVKEPELYELKLNKQVFQYNRFVGQFYEIDENVSIADYINQNAGEKNFIYNYRPVKIEQLANEICEFLPLISPTDEINMITQILEDVVHRDFYVIKHLKYGVIYLHGKLPDLLKEYLEYKYKTLQELTFVIANSVILEGMNLPIDSLFIFNTYSLQGKELMNLIGRVNRLNTIFISGANRLDRLLPRVHFINNEEHNRTNSNMENKIKLLRSRTFCDQIKNPTLDAFDVEKLRIPESNKAEYIARVETIQENERYLGVPHETEEDKIRAYFIQSGINEFYIDLNEVIDHFQKASEFLTADPSYEWAAKSIMGKIEFLFLRDIDCISDFEVKRLSNAEARNYYENHILITQKKSLNENISSQFKYFKERAQSDNSRLYFGPSYGEESYESESYSKYSSKVYVDLSTKSDEELINLALVKLKMEDDFISFKLNKFIVMLFDYNLITTDEYNRYIYGTTDRKKIKLTKYGLSISLISRLESDGQLDNLDFDQFNNLRANTEFQIYISSVNDFFRFEIMRYIN